MTEVYLPSDQMLMAVGASTLHWGLVETNIDALVAIIFHAYGGEAYTKELPRMLARKVAYLRKCFGNLPALAAFNEEARELLAGVMVLSKIRHDLAHGWGERYLPDRIELARFRVEPTMHHVERKTLMLSEIYDHQQRCLELGLPLATFTKRLMDERPPKGSPAE